MTRTKRIKPFLLGICGGSASGKTTIASTISKKIEDLDVAILSMDSFYRILNEEQHEAAHEAACRNEYNFDCPEGFDFDTLKKTLIQLKEGLPADVPVYDFVIHSRAAKAETIKPAKIIIFEGIMTFHDSHICELLDLKIFVDTNDELRLARRMKRDVADRGQNLEGILKLYKKFVQPAYKKYIEPMKEHADIIIPNGGEGSEAIQKAIIEFAYSKFFQ